MRKDIFERIQERLEPDEAIVGELIEKAEALAQTPENYKRSEQKKKGDSLTVYNKNNDNERLGNRFGLIVSAAAVALLMIGLPAFLLLTNAPQSGTIVPGAAVDNDSEASEPPQESESESELITEIPHDNSDAADKQYFVDNSDEAKTYLLYKMVNSVDFYRTVRGEFICANEAPIDSGMVISFEADIENTMSRCVSMAINIDDPSKVLNGGILDYTNSHTSERIWYCDGERRVQFDEVERWYDDTFSEPVKYGHSMTIGVNETTGKLNSESGYLSRNNPTNIPTADICIFPIEYVNGYLLDYELWDIIGYEEYLGKTCAVVNGRFDDETAEKYDRDTFTMYIDDERGTILKLLCFSDSGELKNYMAVQGIAYDVLIDPVTIPSTDGYTKFENWSSSVYN